MMTTVIIHSFAQAPQRTTFNRNSFWTETVFNGAVHNKWKWQLDYQFRRMSDASDRPNASGNLFKNPFQHVYRPWIHYQLNESVRFSLSPLGFWETYLPSSEGASGKAQIQPEFRICPQLTLSNKIGRVMIDQRYRFEMRYVGNKVFNQESGLGYDQGISFAGSGQKERLRYFVRATIPLGNHTKLEDKTFYLTAWNELFIGLGRNTNNEKIWDQNRTFCLLGFKPAMKFPMRFEMGYGRQVANRFSGTIQNGLLVETSNKIETNNILQVYIIFENFNKLIGAEK
jgi:hypothetical protein